MRRILTVFYALALVSLISTTFAATPPSASFDWSPNPGIAGSPVSFDASGSSDSDGTIVSYEWDFDDGGTDTGVNPSHTFATAGNYLVELVVTDDDGLTDLKNYYVPIEEQQPPSIIAISGPTSGYRGDTITLTATASDPEGDALTYEWFINSEAFPSQTDETFTFTIINNPVVVGPHTIYVRAKDSYGGVSDWSSLGFTTLNHEPIVSAISGPTTGYIDVEYSWSATGSDAEGDALMYEWYVDGALKSGGSAFDYTFDSSNSLGDHTIKVRVQDEVGDYSSYYFLTFNLMENPGPEYGYFDVSFEEDVYVVETFSNSSVTDLIFNQALMRVRFSVDGTTGTAGFCNITIPSELLSGDFTVFIDDTQLVAGIDYTTTFNGTHNTLNILYEHSSHVIEVFGTSVIPDFEGWLFLPFVMLVSLSAFIIGRSFRKQRKSIQMQGFSED